MEWLFEFKARQKEYKVSEARDDLNEKLASEKQEEWYKTPCHAMLIAIRGQGCSEVHIWREEDKLRVLLLIQV